MGATRLGLLILFSALLAGCAEMGAGRGYVKPSQDATGATLSKGTKLPKPPAFYVGSFDTTKGKWGAEGQSKIELQARTKKWMESELLKKLSDLGPAYPYTGTEKSGWLITGHTLHVDDGNALGRFMGLGLGQSKARFQMYLYDLSQSSTRPIDSWVGYSDSCAGLIGIPKVPVPFGFVAEHMATDTGVNIERITRETRAKIKSLYQ
jgi:hypothetical protein